MTRVQAKEEIPPLDSYPRLSPVPSEVPSESVATRVTGRGARAVLFVLSRLHFAPLSRGLVVH